MTEGLDPVLFAQARAHGEAVHDAFMRDEPPAGEPACSSCGCWDLNACDPPCSWREDYRLIPLCSSCAPPVAIVHVGDQFGGVGDVDVQDIIVEALQKIRGPMLGARIVDVFSALGVDDEHVVDTALVMLVDDEVLVSDDASGAHDVVYDLASRRRGR